MSAPSSTNAVHQFLPSISYGDAISNHARAIQSALQDAGYESKIFTEHRTPNLMKYTRHYTEYEDSQHAVVLYHLSIGSPVSDYVRYLKSRRIIVYHNITPSHYIERYNPPLARLLRFGRQELRMLRPGTALALGDSRFNEMELNDLRYPHTGVLPIIVDPEKFSGNMNKRLYKRYADDYTNLLFVGRISPNKRQEDLITAFAIYKMINPRARLFLVGSWRGMETYKQKLDNKIIDLNLVDVHFTDTVTLTDLTTYYRLADVFISMSEHEGFLVPLIEAMQCEVPIIAYAAGAVPGTLGNAGILMKEKNCEMMAHLIDRVVTDEALCSRIIAMQKKELSRFDPEKTKQKLIHYVKQVIDSEK